MTHHSDMHPSLDQLDRDGALREAAERVPGHTRSAFMRRAGAFVGGTLLASGLPVSFAMAQGVGQSDKAILNYALTLEFLEAEFYKEAVNEGALNGETAKFARVVGAHENAHVEALQSALGGDAVKKPSFDFKGTTGDQATFQQTALTLEDTGVKAYLGQVGNIKSKDVLGSAGSILPVEARHAAWIREIVGQPPAPLSFEQGASAPTILAAVKGTGFVQGTLTAPPGLPVTAPGATAG